MLSDPVDLAVPSLGSLAVSLYLPDNEKTITEHFFALQTAWIAPQDVTGATTLQGATAVTKRLLLAGWMSP